MNRFICVQENYLKYLTELNNHASSLVNSAGQNLYALKTIKECGKSTIISDLWRATFKVIQHSPYLVSFVIVSDQACL